MSTARLPELLALVAEAEARAAFRRLTRGPLRPSWSWRVELAAAAMRALMMRSKRSGVHWLRSATEIVPTPAPALRRVRTQDVDAGGVPARWFEPIGREARGTVVYLHGGGFVIGGFASHGDTMARLAALSGARVLGVDYRLAPEHRFPAAHDDCFAAARWAIAQAGGASRVALAGDSAGGNLSVGTLLALRDAGEPLPAAAALLCPWTDPLWTGGSMDANADADFGDCELLTGWAHDYLGSQPKRDPRAFPVDANLAGLPPLYVQVGSGEVLLDQVNAFVDRARRAGVDVRCDVEPDMFHDWQLQAALLPEGQRSMEQLARWLADRLAAPA
jgi:acetyl esterase/lipase